jgi:hypothetical protein
MAAARPKGQKLLPMKLWYREFLLPIRSHFQLKFIYTRGLIITNLIKQGRETRDMRRGGRGSVKPVEIIARSEKVRLHSIALVPGGLSKQNDHLKPESLLDYPGSGILH